MPSTAWRGVPGERGYSAGAAARTVDLIRERDIRTPNQDAAVPLLEQLWRELAKSDPDGTFAGTTYDLTAGNRLPLTRRSIRWIARIANPMSCCRPSAAIADCHNGGTCRPIWPAPSAPSTHRNACVDHSDALLVPVHDLVAGAGHSVGIAALQPIPDSRFLAALLGGLAVLATSGRPIAVRLLASAGSVVPGTCPSLIANPVSARDGVGGTPMLAVGRLGAGITKRQSKRAGTRPDVRCGAAHDPPVATRCRVDTRAFDALFTESTLDRLIDFHGTA